MIGTINSGVVQVANIAAVEAEMPQLPFGLVPTAGEQFVLHGPNEYTEMGITGCYEVTIEAENILTQHPRTYG